MALIAWATHMLQWSRQRVAKSQDGANPIQTASQWGLKAATRLHERGIGSNRASAMAR